MAICIGVWPATIGREVTSACCASVANCNCAAGRCTSSEASRTFFLSRVRSRSAILPEVVVLPDPCRPTIRIGTGDGAFRSMPRLPSSPSPPPSASTSASLTILMTCWAGETERMTSCPTARSRTLLTRSRTTGSATSASSSATRTSRSASATSASDSAPRRRSRSKTPFSLLESASNIGRSVQSFNALRLPQTNLRRCASLRGAAVPTPSGGRQTVQDEPEDGGV